MGAALLASALVACDSSGSGDGPTASDTGPDEELLDDVTVPQLAWTDCGDGFECATASVPMDYDEPRGEQIELALVRLPATDPEQRIGSLFTNPGGPGISGVTIARAFEASGFFPEAIRARFDIIGFDPRGVAGSTPVQCFESAEERPAGLAAISGWPNDDTDASTFYRAAADLADRCASMSGELLNHLSTANVARDMDIMRRAVGDDRLSYLGLSYGSYLGATYAALFPDRVGAVVLDGVLEPTAYAGTDAEDGTSPWLRIGNDVATDETLGEFFRLCTGAGELCPLGEGGDPEARFTELLDALDQAPLVVPDPAYGDVEVRGEDFLLRTLAALPDPTSWVRQSRVLSDMYDLLVVDGDRDGALAFFLELQAQEAAAAPPPDPAAPANDYEANMGSMCVDTEYPADADGVAAAAQTASQRAPYSANRWGYNTLACSSWAGVDDDRYTGPFAVETAQPLLVVGTRHDPSSAYRSSESFAAELPSAGLLTLEGWGHTASFQGRSTCIDDAVSAYLIAGTMPAEGASCEPDPSAVPFTAVE